MPDRTVLEAKARAVAVHLAASFVLVGIALALMWFVWFPSPLFHTDGGGIGIKLLVFVDLVLGPLLTFIVFDPRKARGKLLFDLSTIALVQLAAYGYGLHSIRTVRIEAVAFHGGVFHAVAAPSLASQQIDPAGWTALGPERPPLVFVRDPKSEDEVAGVAAFALIGGAEPYKLQFLYDPLSAHLPDVRAAGWALDELPAELAATARQADFTDPQLRFHRVEGFYGNAVLAVDQAGRRRGGFAGELSRRSR